MWLVLLACGGGCRGEDSDSPGPLESADSVDTQDSPVGPSVERVEGRGGGFGWRLVSAERGVLVAAPWFEDAGRVYLLGESESSYEGERSFGLGLASLGGETRVEAPLADSELVGSRIEHDESWLSTELEGVDLDGRFVETPSRPWSATMVEGELVVGVAQGGVWTEAGWLAAAPVGSELGLSSCSADLDGDGVEDLAVGAPGAAQVWLWRGLDQAPTALHGEGRFGQSLHCEPGQLLVGAPLAAEGAGQVWAFVGEERELLLEGESGDRLGMDVLVHEGEVYAGAPGSSESFGAVLVLR